MQLGEKVALVTGAGSGIGNAAAWRMARAGAKIGALGRDDEKIEEAVEALRAAGHEAIPLVADISKPEQMARAVQTLIEEWGRLDVVFANAGINGVWAPIEELSPDEWRRTIDVNLNGTYFTLHYSVPHMKARGGSIVVTASVNGTRVFSNTGATAYSSTKAAQVAMTKMLALELAKHRIRVNVICPGAISTHIDESTDRQDLERAREPAQYPEGRIPLTDGDPGSPEQVADLVLFLASDMASHITGTEIWIDGAESLLQG